MIESEVQEKRILSDSIDAKNSKMVSLSLRQLNVISIGPIPLPAFLAISVCVGIGAATGKLPKDITTIIALLAVFGFALGELGAKIPVLRMFGGPVILAGFVPSFLIYYQLLPASVVTQITAFWKNDNPLSLFVTAVIVGSILSMDRKILISGFIKIFAPLSLGSIAAAVVAVAVGTLFGLPLHEVIFFIVVPIMAGGLGEGAIPLSLGYALLMGIPQADVLARIIPIIMLANVFAISLCGLLGYFAANRPKLTGYGVIQPEAAAQAADPAAKGTPTHGGSDALDLRKFGQALFSAVALYMIGMLIQQYLHFPGPIAMLAIAIAIKLLNWASPNLQEGASQLYRFCTSLTTFPLLFAIGATLTPWDKLVAAVTLANIVTIFSVVFTLMISGFLLGRRLGIYPVEAAIINACHSGLGGGGDVAILTAANRMQLMPFAQIATRIGGLLTVLAALSLLKAWPI